MKWMILFLVVSPAMAAKTIPMQSTSGQSLGAVDIQETKKGLKMVLDLHGLSPGVHAMHFHENAKCEGPDFKSAGSHLAMKRKKHGDVAGGPHEGDLPNITVDSEGNAKTELMVEKFDHKSLAKKAGTSLVVHAKADDHKSQPAGDSGDRVACGILE